MIVTLRRYSYIFHCWNSLCRVARDASVMKQGKRVKSMATGGEHGGWRCWDWGCFFVISMTIRVQTHVKLAELTTRFGFTCTPQLTRQINIVEDGLMALGEKRLGTCHCVWSVWWSLLVHYANIVAIDLEEMNFYLEYNLCKNRRDYVHHLVSPDRRGQPPTLRYCMRWKIQSGQPNRLMNNKS